MADKIVVSNADRFSGGDYRLQLPELPNLVNYVVRGFEHDIRAYSNREWSLTEWTNSVYRTFRHEGQQRGYEVYCSDRTPGFGEYLLDVVWFNPTSYYADLVVESEWKHKEEVAYDFEKLLWVKANLKVMICDPRDCRAGLLPAILQKIRRYPDHREGETYLVIDVCGGATGGAAFPYLWQPLSEGKNPDATFNLLCDQPFKYSLSDAS